MLRRLWPSSLAGRTALVLILALMVVQAAGLTIHALDRVDLQRRAEAREVSLRGLALWRSLVTQTPDRRAAILADAELPSGLQASLGDTPLVTQSNGPVPERLSRMFRLDGPGPPGPRRFRPLEVLSGVERGELRVSLRFPDTGWLNLSIAPPRVRPWHSDTFLAAFVAMSMAAALLILWAVRRLTRPVRDLAAAAERLGRDVNAPDLPETGPREVATAAAAFNTMAGNIRRFVADRTQMLAAIGHDLRTPITRLRLRAEMMEDDALRERMLRDLEEMEAMIGATLTFARDDAAQEAAVPLDLAALARTVTDEAADARESASVSYEGPDRLVLPLRPVATKRAVANLVNNALLYGGTARVSLGYEEGEVVLAVEDDGPGIPPEQMETVFRPFHRLEASRNRETGGSGLGLTIARSIARAGGGDIRLHNREEGGLRAELRLPA
ncbi:ATP-binding protein [Sabulicella rubraurantiaca]|uniref:ATP-binding protein n=1 Tax=Sabulicella rubraurantiaca TaxID=2811429 RepID=UPI001A96571D|nr:ATP-binding protein [Sabulicella rubraurantiaca]